MPSSLIFSAWVRAELKGTTPSVFNRGILEVSKKSLDQDGNHNLQMYTIQRNVRSLVNQVRNGNVAHDPGNDQSKYSTFHWSAWLELLIPDWPVQPTLLLMAYLDTTLPIASQLVFLGPNSPMPVVANQVLDGNGVWRVGIVLQILGSVPYHLFLLFFRV